jgi:hypothetical protein
MIIQRFLIGMIRVPSIRHFVEEAADYWKPPE